MNDRAATAAKTQLREPDWRRRSGAYSTAADTARRHVRPSIDIIAGIAGESSYVMPATNTATRDDPATATLSDRDN